MTDSSFDFDLQETSIAIVGVGLMGGSLAAALRKRHETMEVIGVGRSLDRLQHAQSLGLITFATTDLEAAISRADIVVVCTPVNRIVEDVLSIGKIASGMGKELLITDVGSVKQVLVDGLEDKLPSGVEFLGSHPIAGSEKTGFEHSDADLFVEKMVVVTPTHATSQAAIKQVNRLWKSVGAKITQQSPQEHDKLLARTSHLPHLVASVLASFLTEEEFPFTGTGFQGTTRIATGDPSMWTAIFEANAEHVALALETLEKRLSLFRAALEENDIEKLHAILSDAKWKRERLN